MTRGDAFLVGGLTVGAPVLLLVVLTNDWRGWLGLVVCSTLFLCVLWFDRRRHRDAWDAERKKQDWLANVDDGYDEGEAYFEE